MSNVLQDYLLYTLDNLNLMRTELARDTLSDQELVEAALRGDTSAFKALYERYRVPIYNLIHYTIGSIESSEDVLQSVFIKVFQNLQRFRQEASFKTWLYRIAINEAKNFRRTIRGGQVPIESVVGTTAELDFRSSPEMAHFEKQRRDIVFGAVRDLPEKFRTVIVLKYVDDLSYEEIAQVLSTRIGTVASRLSRALLELEQKLKSFDKIL